MLLVFVESTFLIEKGPDMQHTNPTVKENDGFKAKNCRFYTYY